MCALALLYCLHSNGLYIVSEVKVTFWSWQMMSHAYVISITCPCITMKQPLDKKQDIFFGVAIGKVKVITVLLKIWHLQLFNVQNG